MDVWSEKCLPPGTVHLGFPRIFNIAKKLNVDYAPAMVGFEFKNGRSYPLYNGIVVCSEFKDMILDVSLSIITTFYKSFWGPKLKKLTKLRDQKCYLQKLFLL